jgi:rubrerythrin
MTTMQLTPKEQMLLTDMQKQEELCIAKYQNYAQQAQTPQLKQLFQEYAGKEQQHYDTIAQLLQGQVPSMSGQQQAGQSGQAQQRWAGATGGMIEQTDAMLCADALATEKYASSAYDAVIFQSLNQPIRQALQHIQQEEQQHGEGILNYMYQHNLQ